MSPIVSILQLEVMFMGVVMVKYDHNKVYEARTRLLHEVYYCLAQSLASLDIGSSHKRNTQNSYTTYIYYSVAVYSLGSIVE